jgi:hypothetical protein
MSQEEETDKNSPKADIKYPVIYIAGPYRDSRGEYYVRQNIRKAERAALSVWLHGGIAICPHKNSSGLTGAMGIQDDVWLYGYLELLRRSDAIWLLEGWQNSQGATMEMEFARKNGIPTLYSQQDANDFMSSFKKSTHLE